MASEYRLIAENNPFSLFFAVIKIITDHASTRHNKAQLIDLLKIYDVFLEHHHQTHLYLHRSLSNLYGTSFHLKAQAKHCLYF